MTHGARGCLLGMACGDALGRPLEGLSSRHIAAEYGRVTEMRGDGGPAGTGTAETGLALCGARSLVATGEFDGADVGTRYADWFAATDADIGEPTATALRRLADGVSWRAAGREGDAGPGAAGLVRAAPYALTYRGTALAAVVAADARITAVDRRRVEAAVALAAVLAGLVDETTPRAALDAAGRLARRRDAPRAVRTALATADDQSLATLGSGSGAVDVLETGLHAGLTADTAEAAIVAAVNRGGATTATGAVAGAVAGARFGVLPDRWLDALVVATEARELADTLADHDVSAAGHKY